MHRKGHRQGRPPIAVGSSTAVAALCALLLAGVGPASAAVGQSPRVTPGLNLSITVTPDPAYVGGSVTVTFTVLGEGDIGEGNILVVVNLPAWVPASALPANCQVGLGCVLYIDSSGNPVDVQLVLTPTVGGQFPISGQVGWYTQPDSVQPGADRAAAGQTASAVLTVLQPSITVQPPVGSPGTVVLVRGTDFPPGEPIRLAWNPGITATATAPTSGADGSFVAQLLIMGGDQTGERVVQAAGTGFSQVSTPFLVTRPQLLPPLLGAVG